MLCMTLNNMGSKYSLSNSAYSHFSIGFITFPVFAFIITFHGESSGMAGISLSAKSISNCSSVGTLSELLFTLNTFESCWLLFPAALTCSRSISSTCCCSHNWNAVPLVSVFVASATNWSSSIRLYVHIIVNRLYLLRCRKDRKKKRNGQRIGGKSCETGRKKPAPGLDGAGL